MGNQIVRVKPHNSPPFKILYKETTMNKKFIFAALATSFLLTACSSDDGFNGSLTTSPLSFKVENEVVTRTTTENEGSVYKTKFVVGESIGIYGYEANNKKILIHNNNRTVKRISYQYSELAGIYFPCLLSIRRDF